LPTISRYRKVVRWINRAILQKASRWSSHPVSRPSQKGALLFV
jgi:hypothetical protein